MSRQIVDIGVQGNDGTGDSIRESFRKVNENFQELYSVLLKEGSFNFQDIRNVTKDPITGKLGDNRIITTSSNGENILARELFNNGGIDIDLSDPSKIKIRSTGGQISSDPAPRLSGALDAATYPIGRLADPSDEAVGQFNGTFFQDSITTSIDELAVPKGYADRRYLRKNSGNSNSQIKARQEPKSKSQYSITFNAFTNGNILKSNHGYDSTIDGNPFTYQSTIGDANGLQSSLSVNTNLVIGYTYKILTIGTTDFTLAGAVNNKVGEVFIATTTGTGTGTVNPVYFLKYVTDSQLSIHPTFDKAQSGTDKIMLSGGTGVQTLTDAYFDDTLLGNWARNEVLPRSAVVRRQGDKMEGPLYLSDHPFPLTGAGTPVAADDLQAATKYYVDASSFASTVDLYVNTVGDDIQLNSPPGKEGRAWAYAFKTLGRACEKAEYLIKNAPYETGPYRQLITYNNSATKSVLLGTEPGIDGTLKITFTNQNGTGAVDQGAANNRDITPGKLLKGRTSGAYGFIYSYNGPNGTDGDSINLQFVSGTFAEGENLEFGDAVKSLNITIYVESGIYEEDFPIKVPTNTSIVGDEFRRTIIRPRDRVSESPWIDTWFFRNAEFDGITGIAVGNTSDSNYDSALDGYYGFHYLKNPLKFPNLGLNYDNAGGYTAAAAAIRSSKATIANDIIDIIKNSFGETLSDANKSKSRRDIGYIVNAIAKDLEDGGQEEILNLQKIFANVTLSTACQQGMAYLSNYINANVIASQPAIVKTVVTNMISKLTFVFNVNYNAPKNNKELDVFLMNDATIIRQITCQGHGGFMMVLDPEGQILTKSPYCQQSGSFSGSINKQRFAGGQYIDAFAGNVPADITKINNFTLTATGFPKELLTPTSFFINGVRYKINSWAPATDTRPNSSNLLSQNKKSLQSQTLIHLNSLNLDYALGPMERAIDRIIDGLAFDLLTSGNIKTLAATRRLFNFGRMTLRIPREKDIIIEAINKLETLINALILPSGEAGSTGFISNCIGSIRTTVQSTILTTTVFTSTINPTYKVLLDTLTPLISSPSKITILTGGNNSMLSNDYTQVNDLGYGIVTNNNGLAEAVSLFTYYCWSSYFSNNGGQIRSLNGSTAYGQYGLVAAGSSLTEVPDAVNLSDDMIQIAKVYKTGDYATFSKEKSLTIYVTGCQYVPYNVSIIEINHGADKGIARYEMSNVKYPLNDPAVPVANRVLQLNFNTSGNNDSSTSGLLKDLVDGQTVIIRSAQNFKFSNVENPNPTTRPSTALTFLGDAANDADAPVYRVIDYRVQNPLGEDVGANQTILTFDSTYNYIQIITKKIKAATVDNLNTGKTLGYTVGDVRIAIEKITNAKDLARLNTGQMLFGWDGKVHRVVNYTYVPVDDYGIITISDLDSTGQPLTNLNTFNNPGLNSTFHPATNISLDSDQTVTLRAGLAKSEPANIVINISTMRATGHDFLDVGTGGYNTTNYPSRIYGDPFIKRNQSYEVQERTRGRVFYVSTDQNGFFRVGRFFTVDQGTGTVTFAASIALSNLDGLGFKRGVAIAEFSTDDIFLNPSADIVPVQQAVYGYINKRLGLTDKGAKIASIGPGFLDRQGVNTPQNDIDWGGYNIVGLPTLTAASPPSAAANKTYVDNESSRSNELNKLKNVLLTTPSRADVLAFVGKLNGSVNAQVTGDLAATLVNPITTKLKAGIGTTNITSLTVEDASAFPGSGFVQIGDEVFQYNTRTTRANSLLPPGVTGTEKLDGITRLSLSSDQSAKFTQSVGAVAVSHNIDELVISLNQSQINFQINPDVIINADVKSDADILQSKLKLNLAQTNANAPTGTAADKQAVSGLSSFNSSNFNITEGWVSIKTNGVLRSNLESSASDTVLGNLTNSSSSPADVSTQDVYKRAIWNLFNNNDINNDYALIFAPGSNQAASTFSTTPVSVTVSQNSLVKRSTGGSVKINSIETDGGIAVISTSSGLGSDDKASPVIYKGQWSAGTNATFAASSAAKATNLIGGNNTTQLGSIPYQSNSDVTTLLAPNTSTTKNFLTQTGTGTNGAAPSWGTVSASDVGLGNVTNESKVTMFTNPTFTGTVTTTAITTGNSSTAGTITGDWSLASGSKLQSTYADLAEYYTSDKDYEVGTVLIFGGNAETTITNTFGDTRLAGVVSKNPAYVMNTDLLGPRACIALQGRVFCKVVGRIKKGDLLTTAGVAGHAAKAIDPKIGAIIGKALMDKDSIEAGMIEISVGRT
jgi:hypothetical protein